MLREPVHRPDARSTFMAASRLAAALAVGASILTWATAPLLAQDQLESEVEQALAEYVRAINEGRAADLARMYLEGATTGSLGDGQIHRGSSAVTQLLRSVVTGPGAVQLEITDVTVTPLGPSAAIAYFDTEWRYGPPASTRVLGAMSVAFVRQAGTWRVAHDHTSSGQVEALSPTTTPNVGAGDMVAEGPPEPVRQTTPCEVTRIVDGDTIDCAPFGRVRLIGMDTPEADQQPFGDMATETLARLISVGRTVQLERDVEPTDRYDRVLGYIWAEGQLVNWWLVRTGYAVVLTYPPNVQYVDWFTEAQRRARADGAGLWAVDGFSCEPREHRQGRCE